MIMAASDEEVGRSVMVVVCQNGQYHPKWIAIWEKCLQRLQHIYERLEDWSWQGQIWLECGEKIPIDSGGVIGRYSVQRKTWMDSEELRNCLFLSLDRK